MSKQHYKTETYKARSSIGYLLKRSHALMLDNMEPAFAKQGFTFMQWVVLMYLRDGIALNPKDICSKFRHNSGALSRVIDQLAERGLLERTRGVADRRMVELRLTAAGRETVETLIPTVVDKLNTALVDFSRDEVREFTRMLIKLNDAMQLHLETATEDVAAAGTKA